MSRSESLAAFGAAPFEDKAAVLGRHARAKTVGLRPTSVVRLKGPLRHSDESPIKTKTLRLIFVTSYVKKPKVVKTLSRRLRSWPFLQITGAARLAVASAPYSRLGRSRNQTCGGAGMVALS